MAGLGADHPPPLKCQGCNWVQAIPASILCAYIGMLWSDLYIFSIGISLLCCHFLSQSDSICLRGRGDEDQFHVGVQLL